MNERSEYQGVDMGRRKLWRNLLGELLVIRDELRGVAHMSMNEIERVPDGVLAEMVPVWREGLAIEVRDDGIYRPSAEESMTRAYAFAPHEKIMADQYACGRNLRRIAEQVASVSGLAPAESFQAVKSLFVRLCRQGWCHPAAAHRLEKGETR